MTGVWLFLLLVNGLFLLLNLIDGNWVFAAVAAAGVVMAAYGLFKTP